MLNPQHEQLVIQAVHDGNLEIVPDGTIWRLKKRTYDRWTQGTKTTPCNRVRAESASGSGYFQVRMMRDGKRVAAAAHRLVYLYFMGEIPLGMTVNHKDGNKSNNHPANLELATMSEQRIHAVEVLNVNRNRPKGSKHPKTHLLESDVLEIRKLRAEGKQVKDIAALYKMRPKAVSAICCRRTWTHVA